MTKKKPEPKPRKKPGPKPGTGGRPRKSIDWDKVDALCAIHCTRDEISEVLGVGVDALIRASKREKGMDIGEYIARKALRGKMSLRRRQWKSAEAGDRTMLVWLGKQWLGQTDKIEQVGSQDHKVVVYLPDNGRK